MEFEDFKALIKHLKKTNKMFRKLENIGFSFLANRKFPLWEQHDKLFDITISSHYTDMGVDWINWFVYENDFGKGGLTANDRGNPICYDLKSLHEYIEQYKK